MDQKFSFGEWIQKRRSTLGLTQEVLAKKGTRDSRRSMTAEWSEGIVRMWDITVDSE
jgi:hypothetical protein